KQAIDKRFTQAAVEYIKSILEKALKIVIDKNLGHFPNFSELKLKDSTCFQLPEDMPKKYPGCGGNLRENYRNHYCFRKPWPKNMEY
ncbi:MAG: hypothetical protein JEY97_04730, partial [Bacteroidales bacterium]|nr:hypothetical protein [Bacteroidales bacterium]